MSEKGLIRVSTLLTDVKHKVRSTVLLETALKRIYYIDI